MKVTREQYEARLNQFPEPIRNIAIRSPIVQEMVTAFAAGAIITKEEALAQMVCALSEAYEKNQKDLIRAYQYAVFPIKLESTPAK